MEKQYVLVRDGQAIQGPQAVPRLFAGVRGFHRLPDHQKLRHGWRPVVDEIPQCTERQQLGEPTLVVEKLQVRRVYPVVPKSDLELECMDFRASELVAALAAMTPTQIDAWIDANVNSVADVRRVLKILTRAMRLNVRGGPIAPRP